MSEDEATTFATEATLRLSLRHDGIKPTRIGRTSTGEEGTKSADGTGRAHGRQVPRRLVHTVTTPNAATLYTQACVKRVEKSRGSSSVTDMGGRYYLLPMLDGWTKRLRLAGHRDPAGKGADVAIHRSWLAPGPCPQGGMRSVNPQPWGGCWAA